MYFKIDEYAARSSWAGNCKNSQIIIGRQDPPQFVLKPTFDFFDICIYLFQSILISFIVVNKVYWINNKII